MNTAISAPESRRIIALHEQGFSDRWIARRFDLSGPTVGIRLREIRGETALAPPVEAFPPGDPPLPTDDTPPGYDPANIRRCRGCGALVYLWPCQACCLAEETTSTSPQP